MRSQGTLRVALAFAAFLGSLSMVVWRQSRTLEVLQDLQDLRNGRALAESRRNELTQVIQYLEGRARIMDVAGARWGMRVPASGEVFVLKVRPEEPAPRRTGRLRVATANVGKGDPD